MLAATMLCLASLSQLPPDRPDIFRGTVVEKGTARPLVGVSVRVPDGFGVQTATTDAHGRFDGIPAPDTSWFPVDGQNGPPLRIRAENDRAWPWTTPGGRGTPRPLSDYQQREVVEAVYEQQVESRWKGAGPGATLLVECPPVGVVEAVVRGTDGRPLADAAIVVVPLMEFPHNGAGTIHFSGRTDDTGSFRLRSFEGPREFGVLVPGLGFGSTGRIEVLAGKSVRPEIPPLARFARIAGRVDGALKGLGTEAYLMGRTPGDASMPVAPCDEEGRFMMADVLPGDYTVEARRGEQPVRYAGVVVKPGPGQVIRDIVVRPAPPPSPEQEKAEQRSLRAWSGDPSRIITWVEGTISDEEGRPLPGANVYVHVMYHGGMRMHSEVKKTKSDPQGRYRFEGPLHPSMGTLSVAVAAKGRPLMVACAPAPDSSADPEDLKPSRLDVAVGSQGGSLAVTVLRDGRREERVNVRLTSTDTNRIFAEFARSTTLEERNELNRIAVPNAVTGADGVARFKDLPPGTYQVVATAAVDPTRPFTKGRIARTQPAQGIGRGIDVSPGARVETTVAILDELAPTRFRLLAPDGAPVANRSISLGVGGGGGTSVQTDGRGECEFGFGLGLWTVDLRYRDSELKVFPVREEPFYQAEAPVAVSPAIPPEGPIVLHAVRRERGAIRARLLGLDGTPARGGVMILDAFGSRTKRAGTVDDQGWIRFADIPSGKYGLRAAIDSVPPVPRPSYGPTRLTDDDLKDRAMIFDREVAVEPGAETVVDLRLEPVGYVRATLRPPAGHPASEFMASLRSNELPGQFSTFEVSEDGAVYLLGPMPAGRWPMVVQEKYATEPDGVFIEREVVAEPGRVVHVEVAIEARPGAGRPMASQVGDVNRRFDLGPNGAAVTVFMPDGETPAFGAHARFIPAEGREPVAEGTADAAGYLTWMGIGHEQRREEDRPEPVVEPTVIAWAPGVAGPVVATRKVGEPLRLVLPVAAGVSGRVTIGGEAATGRDARIRVVLASEGRGAVEVAMRRETAADPDGRFRFGGLAPGRYLVQAARDDLWVSKPLTLVVEPGKEAAPIDVDLPEPGPPIALQLADRQGNPVTASFSIRKPAGPLGDLAPIAGRTDDRGEAIIRGLAAGVAMLMVDGDPAPRPLDVPVARPNVGPLPVRIEVVRPGP